MAHATAFAAAALLGALGLVHVFWAFGGVWPARTGPALAKAVVGPAQEAMPGAVACLGVAALLAAAAALVLARAELVAVPGPQWIVDVGTWVIAGVLAARAAVGLVTWVKADHSQLYHRLDVALYSPLCLLIAALCLKVARA